MKPTDPIQCCGTCRWAGFNESNMLLREDGHYYPTTRFPCLFKPEIRVSIAFRVQVRERYVPPEDGTSCPCYERNQPEAKT